MMLVSEQSDVCKCQLAREPTLVAIHIDGVHGSNRNVIEEAEAM